jgi:hypothetical protein
MSDLKDANLNAKPDNQATARSEVTIDNNRKSVSFEDPNAFHLRTVAIAGVGFLIDAYDKFVIGMVNPMVYEVYYPSPFKGGLVIGVVEIV